MKKVLSVLLTSAFTYNMTAVSFGMENKDWEKIATNQARANTYKLKLPDLTGLFVFASSLIKVSSTPSVASPPSPLPPVPSGAPLPFTSSPAPIALSFCVPQSPADNASWSNFEIFMAVSTGASFVLSLGALGYTIFYNHKKGPIAELENRVDALETDRTNLTTKANTLENALNKIGEKKVANQNAPMSLNQRLDDIETKQIEMSKIVSGDGQQEKGLKSLLNGDPKSSDPLEKNGLYKGVKKIVDKLSNYGSKEDLEKHANTYITKSVSSTLSTLLEEKTNLINKTAEENKVLAEKIKQLEEENKVLKNQGITLTSSPQIQSSNSVDLQNKKK